MRATACDCERNHQPSVSQVLHLLNAPEIQEKLSHEAGHVARWLRSLPDARNLVILNGDAIAFNAVYRDRDVVWNILDLPYSLVFFSHRNPIDRAAGFTWQKDEHAASPGEEAVLFAASDTPVLRSLHVYREQPYEDNGGHQLVTGTFEG